MNVDPTYVKSLLSYASKGDAKQVEKCLSKVPVDSVDDESQTALHFSCANGHKEVVHMLIKKGAPLDSPNWCGWVPIMLACCYGHVEVVKLLIENKAKINVENDRAVSPLTCASRFGWIEIVKVLLEHNLDILNSKQDINITPLIAAAQHGHVKIVNVLLQHNMNSVDYCNPDTGYSALLIAATNGHLDIVRILIEKGRANPNLMNTAGYTAYEMSVKEGKHDVTGYLKSRKNVILTLKETCGKTCVKTLIDATKSCDLGLVRRLLADQKNDINMTNERGATPLAFACVIGNIDIVQLLLDSNANPNIQDMDHGWTALMQSTLKSHVDIIILLLRHGADVNVRNNENLSAFDIAIIVGDPNITRILAPNSKGAYDAIEVEELEKKVNKQTLFDKIAIKTGIKQKTAPTFSRVPVQLGDVALLVQDDDESEELKKTSSVISVFDDPPRSTKPRIPLLSPRVELPDDVVAPTLAPFLKLHSFDLPKMPTSNTRLSSSNGSNTEWSPKNSSDDSTQFQAMLQNMGKKKGRNLKRQQEDVVHIAIPMSGKEPDSPQSSMTSSGFTSISRQKKGPPPIMPTVLKHDSPAMHGRGFQFDRPTTNVWLQPSINVSGFHKMTKLPSDIHSRRHKKSTGMLPNIHTISPDMAPNTRDLSIRSVSSDIDEEESDEIKSLLQNLDMEKYHSNFEEQDVDMCTLKEMDNDELIELGITKTIHRDRLLNAVRKENNHSSKSRSVHDSPMDACFQPLLITRRRPESTTSVPLDLKFIPPPAYKGTSKEKLTAL